MKKEFCLILHNVRSAHNVGAIFRTADGCGIDHIYLTGYTPTPPDGSRPFTTKPERKLIKTALGSHEFVAWSKVENVDEVFEDLKKRNFQIVALEQGEGSIDYKKFEPEFPLALVLGNEPVGIDDETLQKCDIMIDIPMRGQKNSLNVSVAAGIAMYEIMSNF
ncbi:MAG: RNA methyltransferase [Candidatus Moranbacteria bacterium]|nr:RNA methyltransferase [Candidatus Moranbacteria bacterium]